MWPGWERWRASRPSACDPALMPSRIEIVRHILLDWFGGLAEHATEDFAIEGEGGIRLGLLKRTFYPDLTVTPEEIAEIPGDRVFARATVRSRDRPDALRWPAAAIFQFRGQQVASVWSVTDHMPWLAEVGVLDMTELDRRFDEALGQGDDPPPS